MPMRIKNWEKFQHFKDRRPPWVKLYRDLLDDKEWHKLEDAPAKLLTMLWLLASESDGDLPDAEEIAFRVRLPVSSIELSLSKLKHFVRQDDINVISGGYQSVPVADTPNSVTEVSVYQETETEREKEKEKEVETDMQRFRAGKQCPENFTLTDDMRDWARQKAPGVNPEDEFESFKDYTFARTIKNWPGALRNWLKKAQKDLKPRNGNNQLSFSEENRQRVLSAVPSVAAKPYQSPVQFFMDVEARDITPPKLG